MLATPAFQPTALVTDDAVLAARVSALFARPGRYFPVLDGPRMARPDGDNEVVRRRNAIVMVAPDQVLLGGLAPSALAGMQPGWRRCLASDNYEDHVEALRGVVRRPSEGFSWGRTNLGIGLYLARQRHQELRPEMPASPTIDKVDAGTHLLVACERGNDLSEVCASNLAFSCNASLWMFPELPEEDREAWLEELYALGEGGDVSGRLAHIANRARDHLASFDLTQYKNILFVSAGFPWGIAAPSVATTHMYRYPDFGRSVIEGLWASQSPARSARTALLIDPNAVHGSEIASIGQALQKNGTLTRVVRGPFATSTRVQFLLDLLPHDVIVLSSHAGDAPGSRITYEYPDAEGRQRRLVVDRALGIGYDRFDDKFLVTEYHRFHSLDGVDWRDKAGKDALPVGSAMTTWGEMGGPIDRKDYIVHEEPIPRVVGSMGVQMHDGVWFFVSHGFAPHAMPVIVNNSCWSWHELSERTAFAGARAYVGSLFPITDAEAQEVGQALFGRYIGHELHRALWSAQRDVYGTSSRRPYVMVGLPFVALRQNTIDAVAFVRSAYIDGIAHWSERSTASPHEEVRRNARRFSAFLMEDMEAFRRSLSRRSSPQA